MNSNIMKDLNKKKQKLSPLFYGLCLFIIVTLFNTSKYGATFSWVMIPSFVIVVGLFFEGKLKIQTETFLIFAFWLVYLLSTLFSSSVEIDRSAFTFFIFCIIYVIAVSHQYTKREIQLLINIYILTALLGGLNIVINWFSGNFYAEWFKRASVEFGGVYKDPNYAMAFISPGVFFLFVKLLQTKMLRRKIFIIAALVLLIFATIVSGSRTALAVVFVSFVVGFLLDKQINYKVKIRILFFIFFGLIAVVLLMQEILPDQTLSRYEDMSSDPRWKTWETGLKTFFQAPLFGGGLGATSKKTLQLTGFHSHNVYLDILGDSGLIGASIFLLFLSLNCFKTIKTNRYFIFGSAIAFLLPMFTVNGFNTATFYTPLILMTILSSFCRVKGNNIKDIL